MRVRVVVVVVSSSVVLWSSVSLLTDELLVIERLLLELLLTEPVDEVDPVVERVELFEYVPLLLFEYVPFVLFDEVLLFTVPLPDIVAVLSVVPEVLVPLVPLTLVVDWLFEYVTELLALGGVIEDEVMVWSAGIVAMALFTPLALVVVPLVSVVYATGS
jgi:hypothetical protein